MGLNSFYSQVFIYVACFFVVLQIFGTINLIRIVFVELNKSKKEYLLISIKTPTYLRINICLFVLFCEFMKLLFECVLFVDVDVENFFSKELNTDNLKSNIKFSVILIFSQAIFGSVINVASSIVQMNCVSRLREMLEAQEKKIEELKAESENVEMN